MENGGKGVRRIRSISSRQSSYRIGRMSRAGSRGQALIEFALIVTVLLFLLVGLIDVGRLYITMLTLDSAASEGVSYAALRPTDTATAEARALGEGANSAVVDPAQMSASIIQPPQIEGGQPITATVTYSFTPMFPFLNGNTVTLHRSAVAEILQ